MSAAFKTFVASLPTPEQCREIPCECSVDHPHPPIQTSDGLQCDGYGNLYAANGTVSTEKCPCWTARHKRSHADAYLCSLPENLKHTVENADEHRYAAAKLFAQWSPIKSNGVFLQGSYGTGKTVAGHLAMLKIIAQWDIPGTFFRTQTIAADCLALATNNDDRYSAEDRLAKVRRACTGKFIVFIDDLGRERESKATSDRMAAYLDMLYERRAHCVVVTGLSGKQIDARYGRHIASRISDDSWMTRVTSYGADLRITQESIPLPSMSYA